MKRFGTGKIPALAAVLLAALTLCGIAGCATDSPVAVVGHTDDAGITAGVKAALLGDASLKANEIDVDTDQGSSV